MDDRQKEFISFMYWKACVDAVNDMEKEKWEYVDDWEYEDEDDWEYEDEDDWSENTHVVTGLAQPPVSSWAKQKAEKERERIENLRIQSIPMPEKPEKKMEFTEKWLMRLGIFCLCAAAIWVVLGDALYVAIELVAGIWLVCTASKQTKQIYEEKLADYELAQRDFPQYQRRMYEKQKAEAKKQKKS